MMALFLRFFFFFSSRRRHTRFDCDWSSDVCSSDLADYDQATAKLSLLVRPTLLVEPEVTVLRQGEGDPRLPHPLVPQYPTTAVLLRSEERRVGKECRSRWSPYH